MKEIEQTAAALEPKSKGRRGNYMRPGTGRLLVAGNTYERKTSKTRKGSSESEARTAASKARDSKCTPSQRCEDRKLAAELAAEAAAELAAEAAVRAAADVVWLENEAAFAAAGL